MGIVQVGKKQYFCSVKKRLLFILIFCGQWLWAAQPDSLRLDSAQQALYDEVRTSTDATISNSADAYIPSYTVTFSSNNNSYGTVTAKDASGNAISSGAQVKEGDSITFTATAKTGNVFVNWSEFDTKSSSVYQPRRLH